MEQSNTKGNLTLPEYSDLSGIFNTLSDKVRASGMAQMGTFLISENMGGLMIVAPMEQLIRLSRLIATIGSSPIIKGGLN